MGRGTMDAWEKRQLALELYREGKHIADITTRLGYKRRSNVWKMILAALLEIVPPRETIEDVERKVLREQLVHIIGALVDDLPAMERTIIRERFGLDNGWAGTLEDVGRKYSISRERVRQIEARAFQRLRHPRLRRKWGLEKTSDWFISR